MKRHIYIYLFVCVCVGTSLEEGRSMGEEEKKEEEEVEGGGGGGGGGGDAGGDVCMEAELAVFEVKMETFWSREVFPKQYPEWRPPAQWSKVIGRSHDASYKLFRISDTASEALKQFAELGQSDLLDAETQGDKGVMDQFTAPPVTQGAGVTHTQFFVDGNHSRVSLMSRVVPSPDWFIGVDSFDLCVEGKWVESVVLEVDPLDAGTDNGFTFTSPNWPTIPRKPVTRITAQNPDHPANSFYYPDIEAHPPIATIRLSKVKQYTLAKVFTPPRTPSLRYSPGELTGRRRARPSNRGEETVPETERHTETETAVEEPGQSNTILRPHTIGGSGGMSRRGGGRVSIGGGGGLRVEGNVEPGLGRNVGGKKTLLNTIVNKYKKKYRKNRRGRKMGPGRKGGVGGGGIGRRRRLGGHHRMRAPRDCRVTEWAEWSSCSKTCGIGEQMRTRTVLRQSRRGGRPCPPLQETTWCGSYRDCDLPHFEW